MSDGLLKFVVDFLPVIAFAVVFLFLMTRSAGRYDRYMARAEAFMEQYARRQAELIESSRAIGATLGDIKALPESQRSEAR
jgi:hypothetical protein